MRGNERPKTPKRSWKHERIGPFSTFLEKLLEIQSLFWDEAFSKGQKERSI